MSKELIRLTNLTMTFEDGETILDNINLYINNKEFLEKLFEAMYKELSLRR